MTASQRDRLRSGLPLIPRWLRVLLAVAVISALVYFSIRPPPGTGSRSYGPLAMVPLAMWLHVTGYMGLSIVLGYATHDVARPDWQLMLGVFVVTVGIGATVELIQLQLPSRTFSTLDIGLNALGAAIGIVLFYTVEWLLRRYRLSRHSPPPL